MEWLYLNKHPPSTHITSTPYHIQAHRCLHRYLKAKYLKFLEKFSVHAHRNRFIELLLRYIL